MRKRIFAGMVLVLAMLFVMAVPVMATWYVDDDNCPDGTGTQTDPFCTIQDAVNAASDSDTIVVAAGTYNSSYETFPINVNKNGIILLGAQANVDPRPSQGGRTSDESIIDADETTPAVIQIQASGVEINGFTITGGTGDMVEEKVSADNLRFRYNILYDDLATCTPGDEGIQIKYSDGVIMEYNYAYNICEDAFNLSSSSNGVVRYNEAHDIYSRNAAIYCYDEINIDIIGNLVYNVPNNDGIKLGDSGDGSTGGTVKDNEVHHAVEDGITIYASGVIVENNTIYNCDSENGALYLWGAPGTFVRNNKIYDNDAIGLLIVNSSNVTVRHNEISNNDDTNDTKYSGSAGIWLTLDTSNVDIHYNCITGNADFGLRNEAATVDAINNWWGDVSGPYHPTSNSSGTGDAVSDNVDFDPWLTMLMYTGATALPTDAVVLEVTIENSDVGGLVGVDVDFYLNGDFVGTASTNADGVATLTLVSQPVGVYEVRAVGGCATALIAVYDPEGGFVTGGGWIDSPVGAYMPVPDTIVVTPEDVDISWFPNDTRPPGYTDFVEGPNNPPLGIGSLEMGTSSGSDKAQLFNYDHIGTPLADIESITYATYRDGTSTNPPAQYPAINIEVDYIGDGSSYTTLVWEPIYAYGQTNLAVDTWQTWDTMAPSQTGFAGGWWSTKDIPGVCAFNCFVDWDTILLNNPDAKIKYGFGVNVGSGWNGVFTGSVDALSITADGQTTVYDFEPFAPPTGKATFGFVSKYKKGATVPTGQTEFMFKAANLNFHSSEYDWLVVNKNESRAQFKGSGTINGEGDYKFMLWATDGEQDTFRIKIWWEDTDDIEHVVYDNGFEGSGYETGQPIGGGNIIVHTGKK